MTAGMVNVLCHDVQLHTVDSEYTWPALRIKRKYLETEIQVTGGDKIQMEDKSTKVGCTYTLLSRNLGR